MFLKSRLLRGACTVVAGATLGLGLPSLTVAANAGTGTNGHTLVFDDCAQAPTATTTDTTTTDGNMGDGEGCTTQASINTNKTLSVTLTDANGDPVAGQDIDFSLVDPDADKSSFFPNDQPAGTTSNAGTQGQTATCTTNAQGKCSVNVRDTEAETVEVDAAERGVVNGATAYEYVDFRTGSTAPARLDQSADQVIAPENDSPNTAASDSTEDDSRWDDDLPTPGRPVQLTYTVRDLSTSGAGTDCDSTAPDNFDTCSGNTLAFVPLTLHLSGAAFFTPNCQPEDISETGSPQRNGAIAIAPVGNTPGTPSQGALVDGDYHDCTFTTTPADGVETGNLSSLGQSITVVTDQDGQFTVTVAEGRDADFDDDGLALVQLTATSGSTTLTARSEGTGAAADANSCGDAESPDNEEAGCNSPIIFVSEYPLNGDSATIVPVGSGTFTGAGSEPNNGTLEHGKTNNLPNNQFRVFTVQLKDQYGNLTYDDIRHDNVNGCGQEACGGALVTLTGAGTLYVCSDYGDVNSNNDPCPLEEGAGFGTQSSGQQQDVTNGSFTDLDQQQRFAVTAENFNSCAFGNNFANCDDLDTGSASVSVEWQAPITTFWFSGTPKVFTGYHYLNDDLTDSVDINWFEQSPTHVTLTVTPSNTVKKGVVVTVTATVTDDQGNPVAGTPIQFIRSGPAAQCSATSTPAAGQPGALATDNAGKAGFSFTCNDVSVQTVTVIVSDGNGNELNRKATDITFKGRRVAEHPTLKCFSPRKHVIRCVVQTDPRVKGAVVVFRNAKNNHFKGTDATNRHGRAHLVFKGLKSGKHHRYIAHVRHTATTRGADTNVDGATVK